MKTTIQNVATALAMGLLLLSGSAMADGIELYTDGIAIDRSAAPDAVSLTVAGPGDFSYRSPADTPRTVFGLADMRIVQDGLYRFEVKQFTYKGEQTIVDDFNGRGRVTKKISDAVTRSGHFRVKGGAIVLADQAAAEEASK